MDNQNNIKKVNQDLNSEEYETINIKDLIYCIRGMQVILDSDVAMLYHCKNGTKSINQAVKRNLDRFPERFMFQLSESEYNNLRSQIGTAKKSIKNKKSSICFYRTRNSNAGNNYKN